MARQEILNQVKQTMGFVPDWINDMPDAVLDQYWTGLSWVTSDSKLSAKDKALVAFGAASAIHCRY